MSDVTLFNAVLRRHEALISGSTALHFLMPTDAWVPNDLDVYVSDTNFPALLCDLTDPNGLNFVSYRRPTTPTSPTSRPEPVENDNACKAPLVPYNDGHPDEPDPDHDEHRSSDSDSGTGYASDDSGNGSISPLPPVAVAKGIRDVRTLYTPSGRRVDVIRSPSTSPITPLRFFWSTAVINFITPDAYVCGFPHATLSRLGVLKQGALRRRDKAAIAKYEQRGYSFLGQEWREMADTWDYLFFGQRNALVVDFRLYFQDNMAVLPIKRTSRGWVPSVSTSLRRPGEWESRRSTLLHHTRFMSFSSAYYNVCRFILSSQCKSFSSYSYSISCSSARRRSRRLPYLVCPMSVYCVACCPFRLRVVTAPFPLPPAMC